MLVVTALVLAAATKELVQLHGHQSRLYTAGYYADHRDFAAAIKTLETDIAANPDSAETYAELGRVYFMNNEPEKATEAVKKAVQLNPSIFQESDDDEDDSQTEQPSDKEQPPPKKN